MFQIVNSVSAIYFCLLPEIKSNIFLLTNRIRYGVGANSRPHARAQPHRRKADGCGGKDFSDGTHGYGTCK
ncbi:MAG: hypothetical protein IJB64_00430 [Akkermansia sp.]|nr:hypothetical protein [Akkermansia sp.]